jgi:DNA replication protein DnaC
LKNRQRGGQVETLVIDGELCPHCDRPLTGEWVEFPPALKRKYGKDSVWSYHPCTPECEKKNDQDEWNLLRREARVASLQERSGLTKRLRDYSFMNFHRGSEESRPARAAARVWDYFLNWEENKAAGKGLYLGGGVGTGKTHLAVALMNELIRYKRVPCLFVTIPELLDNLRGTYDNPNRNIDEWMEAVKNADFLVLDDLGSEKATAWVQERLFVIINHRYLESLPTVITSNTPPINLASQVGERTASRILSMSTGIEFEGADYRYKKRLGGS